MGSNPGYLFKSFLLYVNFLVKSWQYSFKFLHFNGFLNFSLRYTLQVAERERSILWQQHKKKAPMAFFPPKRGATGSARPKTTSKLPPPTASEDDEDTISSSTISLQLESTVTSSVRPENRQNNAVALPIKTPLSPKRTNLRKRHSRYHSYIT